MTRPAVTTRPLYWLAQERGKDYTDVLNVAWGLKQSMRGEEPGPAYHKSLPRIVDYDQTTREITGTTTYQEIANRVSALMFLQDTVKRGDVTQLSKQMQDRLAAQAERDLATIQ